MSYPKKRSYNRKGSKEFQQRFQGRMNIMTKHGITQLLRDDVSSPIDKEESPKLNYQRKMRKRKQLQQQKKEHKRTQST